MTPVLPDPRKVDKNPITMAGKLIQGLAKGIDDAAEDIDRSLQSLGAPEAPEAPPEEPEAEQPLQSVTNVATLAWQLDHLLDDVLHLEVDHLPHQGMIDGKPCDCIAKGARELRRHAMETIPIAARQGTDPEIFSAMAKWANHLMEIGTLDAVQSGKYEAEYLSQAGNASNLRKQLEVMLAQLRKTYKEECATCPSLTSLKEFMQKRREGSHQ